MGNCDSSNRKSVPVAKYALERQASVKDLLTATENVPCQDECTSTGTVVALMFLFLLVILIISGSCYCYAYGIPEPFKNMMNFGYTVPDVSSTPNIQRMTVPLNNLDDQKPVSCEDSDRPNAAFRSGDDMLDSLYSYKDYNMSEANLSGMRDKIDGMERSNMYGY